MFWEYVIIIVAILAFLSILGFRVNQEYERSLLFVLGRYITIKGPGLYWIIPFISRIVRVDTRTRTVDIDTQ
ncbi:MAG: SPFH domain-containing protein, partial [Candidatus Izemoplasmatales bacterium]